MADIYEKLLGLETPAAAPQATTEDPYEAAMRRQAALPSQYSQAEPTLRLAAPYRPAAFPDYPPAPWNLPAPQGVPGQPQQVVGEGQAAGAGPRTMPEPRSLVGDILRVPYAFARNAATALPGMPADIANLAAYGNAKAGEFFTGQPVPFKTIPYGQEDLNKMVNTVTGVTGEPAPGLVGSTERVAGAVGSSVGPGAKLRLAEKALRLTGATVPVWNALKTALTSGTKVDAIIGGGSGIGMEAVRQFFSDNPWLLAAGGVLGGIAPALLHGGASLLARPYQRAQAVEDAETALQTTQQTGKERLTRVAQDVQSARDIKDIEVGAAKQAQTGAADPIAAQAEALDTVATGAKADVARATQEAADLEAAATGQAKQLTLGATLDEQRAQAGLAQAEADKAAGGFTGLETTLAQTNPPQGTLATGQKIQEQVAASGAEAERLRAESQMPTYKAATQDIGPTLSDQGVIDLTKADFQPQLVSNKKKAGENLDVIEAEITKAGTASGQLGTENLRSQLETFVDESIGAKLPLSQEMQAWAELGLSKAQKATLKGSGAERAKQALQLEPAEAIPFKDLRAIDRVLGAEGRGGLVGTMEQGKARALKSALNKDFDAFFTTDAGTGMGPAYQLAKKEWLDFRTNFDKSILSPLLDPGAGFHQQKFLSFLHGVNEKTMPQLDFILEHASDETRAAISAHMAAHMASKSLDAAGNLDPKVLLGQVKALRKNGTFEKYFADPVQRQTLMDTIQKMSAADTSIEPAFRKAIAKAAPEQVPARVFEPGNISFTQKFQQISDPQAFKDAVAGWVAHMTPRLQGMKPDAVAKELAPMLFKHDGVSQIDLMFGHIPGAANEITDMLTQHRGAPGKVAAAKAEVAQRGADVQRVEAAGEANLTQVKDTNAQRIASVQKIADEVEAKAQETMKRHAEVLAAGKKVTQQTRDESARAIKDARREQRAAKLEVEAEKDAAKERLRAFKKEAEHGRPGLGTGIGIRRTGLSIGALIVALQAMTSRSPTYTAVATGLLGAEVGATLAHQYFLSPRGQQWLRTGAQQTYGPKAAAFAAQVAGQQVPAMAEEEELVQQQQPTP